MSLFLTEINNSIRNTLNYRQKNNQNLRTNWLNNKSVWVRATSMVSINNNPEIRKKYILYGGINPSQKTGKTAVTNKNVNIDIWNYDLKLGKTYENDEFTSNSNMASGYKQLYDSNNRPLPGITDVSIQNKGNMGSVREATINFTVWSIEQLEIMEKLYMTPGMSILLEWGWNVMANNENTPISSDLHLLKPTTDRCMTKKILAKIDELGGHYDGLQGPISNYSWSIRKDGGFNCSTTINSVGGMFLDMNIHSTSKNLTKPNVDNKRVLEENIKATIRATVDKINNNSDKTLYVNDEFMGGRIIIKSDKYDEGEFNEIDKKGDRQYFVTWSYLEKYIINSNLSLKLINNSNECDDIINDKPNDNIWFDTIKKIKKSLNQFKNILPKLNSENTKLTYSGIDFTADPLIAIIPSNLMIHRFAAFPNERADNKYEMIDKQYFYLKDLLINLRLILNTLNSTETLNEFLTHILTSLNDTYANVWELGILVDENEPDIIKIVDYKIIEKSKLKPYMFKVYNTNNILKDVDISTNIDEKMKANIMYGSNASNANKSNSNKSISKYNFYGDNLTNLASQQLEPLPINSSTDISDDITNDNIEWTPSEYSNNLRLAFNNVYTGDFLNGRSDENVENLKITMKKCIADNFGKDITSDDSTPNDKKFQFLPLNLSITLDGIAGIKFGNIIQIDYLPERYKNKAIFQITNVSHSINSSGWETTLDTIMRVNVDNVSTNDYDTPKFKTINYNQQQQSNIKVTDDPITEKPKTIDDNIQQSNIVWFLDPGHGENLNSTTYKRYPPDGVSDGSGVPQLLEYQFNRQVASKIREIGLQKGLNIEITTTKPDNFSISNEDIKISTRANIVNNYIKQNPDKKVILLSIHGNAQLIKRTGQQGTAGGVMTIVSTKSYKRRNITYNKNFYKISKTYAQLFFDKLDSMWINTVQNKQVWRTFRVKERNDVGIVNFTNCPALLTENGFFTNPIDRKFMLSNNGQNIIAQTHIEAMSQIEKKIN